MTEPNPQLPEAKPPEPPPLPGRGLLGWLGRQVGYVRRALHADAAPPAEKTIYREQSVEEQPHPENSQVKLRRTTIDEVVVKRENERQEE